MNIFYTDSCPIKCASYLDDVRTTKMCLETAQLLCTAANICGGSAPYKSTHINHPCSIWTRQSVGNYNWLMRHFVALCEEFEARRGKKHACEALIPQLGYYARLLPQDNYTPHPNCAANKAKGISYKHMEDVCTAYKLYLADRWEQDKRTPTWYGETR